jgi:hypothetical protein
VPGTHTDIPPPRRPLGTTGGTQDSSREVQKTCSESLHTACSAHTSETLRTTPSTTLPLIICSQHTNRSYKSKRETQRSRTASLTLVTNSRKHTEVMHVFYESK